jgi:hypothetical protein
VSFLPMPEDVLAKIKEKTSQLNHRPLSVLPQSFGSYQSKIPSLA